ncbi:uncharacterized protein [Paramisgurnus dabryanus]|uniref:uncharacterized protein isoform X2 n=1 Tax=Paramisgurnus dabryanus TaxID=90735 RepID=UPI0031F4462E
MLSTSISWIFLLIPLRTVNGGFQVTGCKGHYTKLSCPVQAYIKNNTEINILWKKRSGEKVIGQRSGVSETGDKFQKRTVKIEDDFSLFIEKCDKLDADLYILCIDGKPRCEVRLYVSESSPQCMQSKQNSTESTKSSKVPAVQKQVLTDEKHTTKNHTKKENIATVARWTVFIPVCLFGMVCLFVIFLFIKFPKQKDTTENEKSESKLLNTVIHT